jgi:hypothetical protein
LIDTRHPATAPNERLMITIRAVLPPFLDQSAPVTSIVAIGCCWLGAGDADRGEDPAQIAPSNSATLLLFVPDSNAVLTSVTHIPIPPFGNCSAERWTRTLHCLAQQARELSNGASGDRLIMLPVHILDEMIALHADDFRFRAVVAVSTRESGQPDDESVWKLQRALFDRGLIGIGSVRFAGGEAHCFLASDAIRSVHRLGLGSRGQVTMSTLGVNVGVGISTPNPSAPIPADQLLERRCGQ